MNSARRLVSVLPPLVVGIGLAGAVEMSAGLLLYSDEGFLPALTLILAVETGALALGLWSGVLGDHPVTVEALRRRWLFSLLTFALAAAYSTGLTFLDEVFSGGAGQGLGLALLGSLPLFALGSLLGGMATRNSGAAGGVGVPALAGVAIGFLVTGSLLLPHMAPYTGYLSGLTILSGGALLHGWALDAQPRREVLAEAWTVRGLVRVEEWFGDGGGGGLRVVTENGRVRGSEFLAGGLGRAWEKAVLVALEGLERPPAKILYLGGGSGSLSGYLLNSLSDPEILVVEGTRELVSLCRVHFWPVEEWDAIGTTFGEPWSALEKIQGPFDLILVDLAFLPSLGSIPDLPADRFEALAEAAGPGGSVVLGGIAPPRLVGDAPLSGLLDRATIGFRRVVHYQGEEEGFVLLSGPDAPAWPSAPAGFDLSVSKEA